MANTHIGVLKDLRGELAAVHTSLHGSVNGIVARRVNELALQIAALDTIINEHAAQRELLMHWDNVSMVVHDNRPLFKAKPGELYAAVIARELPRVAADAARFDAMRTMALEPESTRSKAFDDALYGSMKDLPDPPTLEEFNARIDACIAKANAAVLESDPQ